MPTNEEISNKESVKAFRRSLRSASTPQEIMLWSRLRNKQFGFKFRRQHSFGKFVVDFYCVEKHLVIEIDGYQHSDNERYDNERTKYLESLGLRVVRFWNSELNTNFEGVLSDIFMVLNETPPLRRPADSNLPTPPQSSPLRRGGRVTDVLLPLIRGED